MHQLKPAELCRCALQDDLFPMMYMDTLLTQNDKLCIILMRLANRW